MGFLDRLLGRRETQPVREAEPPQEAEPGGEFVVEAKRVLQETIEPILREVKSCAATVHKVPGPGTQLAVALAGEKSQLDFAVEVTGRRIRVSRTVGQSPREDLGLHPLSEVTADLVQSHVADFLDRVTRK